MLNNDKITLRPIELGDSELIRTWRFDPQNYDYFYEFVPNNKDQNKIWMQNVLSNKNEINFIVDRNDINTKEQKSIGMISVLNIDNRNQKCEMGRVIIGDVNSRKLGFGTEAILLLLKYCFNHLNMRKISCEVFAENKIAATLYQKLNFIQEGLLKEHIYKNGEFKDIQLMVLFKDKWQK